MTVTNITKDRLFLMSVYWGNKLPSKTEIEKLKTFMEESLFVVSHNESTGVHELRLISSSVSNDELNELKVWYLEEYKRRHHNPLYFEFFRIITDDQNKLLSAHLYTHAQIFTDFAHRSYNQSIIDPITIVTELVYTTEVIDMAAQRILDEYTKQTTG